MRSHFTRSFSACLLLCSAAAAPIGAQTPSGRSTLPAALVDYFSGAWVGRGNFQSGKPLASDLAFEPALGRGSLLLRHQERSPSTFAFVGLWSMDAASGTPVMLMARNLGGGACVFRSHGYVDGRIVFESDPALRAPFGLERFTFVRTADTTFQTTYEFSVDSGRTWHVGDRQTFTRAGVRRVGAADPRQRLAPRRFDAALMRPRPADPAPRAHVHTN